MENIRVLPLLGRLMISLPFMMSGLGKIAAYGPTIALVQAVGLPIPPLAYLCSIAVELGGGLLLVLGYRVKPVAAIMALFALATAAFFHSNFADQNQMIHFLKNIMMAGGLLQIAYFGAGAFALDNRRLRRAASTADPKLVLNS